MSFAHPWVLLLLIVPAVLVALVVVREVGAGWGGRVAMPTDHVGMSRRWWITRGISAAACVPAAILAVGLLVLAEPRTLEPPQQERVLTNVEIVLDVSGSMASPLGTANEWAAPSDDDSVETRFTAAMASIETFCERREGDAFGLTIFGVEVIRWMPLTKDLAAIRKAAPFLNPKRMPPHMGGTRIGHALKFARDLLAGQPEGGRLVILITDGYSFDLGGNAAFEIAQSLADEGIVVHAICIGSEVAPQQLSDVVVPTGGRVFSAGSQAGLDFIFSHIDKMQPVRLKPAEAERVSFYRPFVWTGLGLVVAHGLFLLGWRWNPW